MEPLKIIHEDSINRPLVARIRAHMLRKGLNPKTLAERAKVGRSFVYDILNGKSTNPTSGKLAAIAEQLGVSVQYLLSGVHQVVGPRQAEWSDVIEIPAITVEPNASGAALITNDTEIRPYYFRSDWIRRKLKSFPEDLRVLTVKGDCMMPTVQEGDILLINMTLKLPNPAGVFVLFDGMGLTVKRLELLDSEKLRVLSDNRQYSAYERNLVETNIVGKVVWLAREMPI